MILSLRYVKEKKFLALVHLVSNKKCFEKKSKFEVPAALFQRLRGNSGTAPKQMREWDALLLHVLLINRFLGVFLSFFCFSFFSSPLSSTLLHTLCNAAVFVCQNKDKS